MCHFMCCRRQSTARLELSAGAMLRDVAGKFMSAFTGRSEHPVTAKLLLVKNFTLHNQQLRNVPFYVLLSVKHSTAWIECLGHVTRRWKINVGFHWSKCSTHKAVHPVTAKSLLVCAIAVPYQAAGLELIALAMLRGTAGKFMAAFTGHSYYIVLNENYTRHPHPFILHHFRAGKFKQVTI